MFEIMSGTIPVLIHIPHDSIAIPIMMEMGTYQLMRCILTISI